MPASAHPESEENPAANTAQSGSETESEAGAGTEPNSESTQHSTGTRRLTRLKRLEKSSGESHIAKRAADRARRKLKSGARVSQPSDLIGVSLASNRYRVKSQLGKGSMAYVFLVEDRRLETDVVIKVPKPELFTTHDFRDRFKRESQLLVRFSHPHVVGVLDVGEYDGLPYVVMPLLSGGSLSDWQKKECDENKRMTPESLKMWLPGVAQALDFCSRKGMVHRDVKPANILFDDDRNAFVGDFGLSKVMYGEHTKLNSSETMAGVVLGTPNYISPEVVLGQPYDGRADQYSLGITVYHMLFGSAPMQGVSPAVTMVNHTQKELQLLSDIRSDVSSELASAVQKSIEKDPDFRFATCEDFAEAVMEALRAKPTPSGSSTSPDSRQSDADQSQSDQEEMGWLNAAMGDQPQPSFSSQNTVKTSDIPAVAEAEQQSPLERRSSGNRSAVNVGEVASQLKSTAISTLAKVKTRLPKAVQTIHPVAFAGGGIACLLVVLAVWMTSGSDEVISAAKTKAQESSTAVENAKGNDGKSAPVDIPTDAKNDVSSAFEFAGELSEQMKNDANARLWNWEDRKAEPSPKPTPPPKP